jgi:hypothetical protein
VSNFLCVFEFNDSEEAEAMLAASIPNTTVTKPDAFYWVVDAIDSNHIGHSKPYRECEKNLYLTYAMKNTAKAMADSGCSASDIGDYLSSRGCTGTLTDARLMYHVNDVRKDMEDYTAVPKPNESDAEALIRMLTDKKCKFIYLYTNMPDSREPSSLEMVTSDLQSVKIRQGSNVAQEGVTGWLAAAFRKMSAFFDDAWSLPSTEASQGVLVGARKIADREKKDKWEPAKRVITVNGKRKMLMAILWATQEELVLAQKYPEVWGHDTKACTDATGVPWWYSVGFREDLRTFIGMRGHIANETQAMFNFVLPVAMLFIHGAEVMDACIAHMGDAKNEFINTVLSMIAKGGVTPNARLLLCAWHLTDRAIQSKFKGTKGLWSDSLYRCFWKWQRCETIEHYNLVYKWFKEQWFSSKVVTHNMPAAARDGALDLIDNLHMRRQTWSLALNIDLPAHDTRTNTFVEVQNHVLMDVVHVRSNLTMQTMVAKEDLVQSRKDRKFAHQNFRTLTTGASKTVEDSSTVVSQVCSFMQDVLTPRMGKIFTKQVSVAAACLSNADTTWTLCKDHMCKVCLQYMTASQKRVVESDHRILVFHLNMRTVEDNDESKVEPTSLGPEWDDLQSTIPVVKYTRVVTAQDAGNGKFLFLCSCGFGFRYQGVCRHIAMILLHASNNSCAGCESENIALRNTAAFAACRDKSLIRRSANDWRGITCSHVSEDSLKNCPSGDFSNDDDDGGQDAGHAPAVKNRTSSRQEEEVARWKQSRDAEITKIQEHFYRVKAKLMSCKREEFFDRAARVDAHMLAAFQELGDVQDIADTTVAHRNRDDPRRGQRPKTPPPKRTNTLLPHKRLAARGGCATPSGMYTMITISDSDAAEELRANGAPSDED